MTLVSYLTSQCKCTSGESAQAQYTDLSYAAICVHDTHVQTRVTPKQRNKQNYIFVVSNLARSYLNLTKSTINKMSSLVKCIFLEMTRYSNNLADWLTCTLNWTSVKTSTIIRYGFQGLIHHFVFARAVKYWKNNSQCQSDHFSAMIMQKIASSISNQETAAVKKRFVGNFLVDYYSLWLWIKFHFRYCLTSSWLVSTNELLLGRWVPIRLRSCVTSINKNLEHFNVAWIFRCRPGDSVRKTTEETRLVHVNHCHESGCSVDLCTFDNPSKTEYLR